MPEPAEAPAGRRVDRAAAAAAAAGVVLLLACAVVTVADVLARRLAGISLLGLVDLSQWLVMTGVFLAMPLAFARRGNVEVSLLHDRLPPRAQRALTVAWDLLAAAFLGIVAWQGALAGLQAWELGDRSSTLDAPMAAYWASLVLGSAACAAVCAWLGWRVAAGVGRDVVPRRAPP